MTSNSSSNNNNSSSDVFQSLPIWVLERLGPMAILLLVAVVVPMLIQESDHDEDEETSVEMVPTPKKSKPDVMIPTTPTNHQTSRSTKEAVPIRPLRGATDTTIMRTKLQAFLLLYPANALVRNQASHAKKSITTTTTTTCALGGGGTGGGCTSSIKLLEFLPKYPSNAALAHYHHHS